GRGRQRTVNLTVLRLPERSLFPALSTARTTGRYLPRGSRARFENRHCVVPLARSWMGRLHFLVRLSLPLRVRNRHLCLAPSLATETSTRLTPPRSRRVRAAALAQPASRALPDREMRPFRRFSERFFTVDFGRFLSIQRLPPLGPPAGPPAAFVFGMRAA